MTTDVDTTTVEDLERALEQAIPCEQLHPECDLEATWRSIVVHLGTGAVCATRFRCDRHAAEYRAFLASPGKNVCRAHGIEVDVRWQPLHPGGR